MGMEKMAIRWRNYRIASISPWTLGPARIRVKTYIPLRHVAPRPMPCARIR